MFCFSFCWNRCCPHLEERADLLIGNAPFSNCFNTVGKKKGKKRGMYTMPFNQWIPLIVCAYADKEIITNGVQYFHKVRHYPIILLQLLVNRLSLNFKNTLLFVCYSGAMLCFYAYVVMSVGSPPPRKPRLLLLLLGDRCDYEMRFGRPKGVGDW